MKPSYEISRRQRRAKAINQEIIVKNNLIAGLPEIINIIAGYNNKVVNVRFEKYLLENLHEFKLTLSIHRGILSVHDYQNRAYKVSTCSVEYIETCGVKVKLVLKENRLDAKKTIEALQDVIQSLKDSVRSCMDDLANFDNEYEDWLNIQRIVKAYLNKYSYRIQGYIDMTR